MKRTRVIVVEDSLSVRRHLVDTLTEQADIEVVGEGRTGQDAIDLCSTLRPDVVTMDMMMPVMTGLEATEHIMAYCPTPILIVSASTNRGEAFRTFDALSAGAIDVLDKPHGAEDGGAWERRFVAAVKTVARIRVITHPRAKLKTLTHQTPASMPPTTVMPPRMAPLDIRPTDGGPISVIVIGASTGGPGTVARILHALPQDFPIPILLVIHISAMFAQHLVDWLGTQSNLPVGLAKDGDPLPPVGRARVLMPTPDRHLVLENGHLWNSGGPEVNFCRPAVDVLFSSVAAQTQVRAMGCVLTGMGKDGAEGLLAIRRAGGLTVAESLTTAIVYGMPQEAANLKACMWALPAEKIAPLFMRVAQGDIPPVLKEVDGQCR